MKSGFIFIPTGNFDSSIKTGYCICENCGIRVETGIFNISTHWNECYGKGFKEALIELKKSDKLNMEEVNKIQEQLNNT